MICACTVTSSAVVGSSSDQQPRPPRHRHRDHHALAHAAGELVRIRMQHALRVADAELAQEIDDARRRARIARESRVPTAASATCSPAVSSGLRYVIGSWKT